MTFHRKNYSEEFLLSLYQALLKPRMIEEKMLILLRQGRISKWFSGIGQEAIAVGATLALQHDEYILPLHRNLGVFTVRDCPLDKLIAQWQGKKEGFTKGRDRSFHFGSKQHHIIGMISHLGAMLPVANGIALGHRLKSQPKVTLVFSGDGGTSQGDFHEALNVAAVWELPVIFLVENNGYGLSTPNTEQFRCAAIIDKAVGYGIEGVQVDGNNILEVYETIEKIAKDIRIKPRPVLVEALTFRMRGHEEASGTKYVPKELFETWSQKDPVSNFENFLQNEFILDESGIRQIKSDLKSEIEQAIETAFALPDAEPNTQEELTDMYSPPLPPPEGVGINDESEKVISSLNQQNSPLLRRGVGGEAFRFIDAISEGLWQSMQVYPNLILMGQDIAEYGGAFKITEGFVKEFGKERVRNTPLCESAIVGASLGLAIQGFKSVVEMQFADFVSCGFNQIINNLAKNHYRWGQAADVVIRMPTGAGSAAGPFHSQSNEAWFFHTPGLKIVYPSNPHDAKGLLTAAIADPNPVLYFEHKNLYRSLTDQVPNDYYTCPIGKAKLVTEGEEISVITYGMAVHWVKQIVEKLGISADILDLRTLLPWDKEAVTQTVKKTGRILVCHEATLTGGIGGEIAAWIGENLFSYLDAPVLREGSLDTAVPFVASLEKNFLPVSRIEAKIKQLLAY
ncbi:MAG: dehydrogenase E1 component subunit alpha/beta [Verrucomicrobia bacterium]|nr:dehydrogenase E1 component subunit alpha/beta [Cytophagales bacterium]